MNDNLLQDYVEKKLEKEIGISHLNIDLENFNIDKNIILFDYQKEALENTIRLLLKYFNDEGNDLVNYYSSNLTKEELSQLNIKKDMEGFDILVEYFNLIEDEIPFIEFINRACYWMATGERVIIVMGAINVLKSRVSGTFTEKFLCIAYSN